LKKGIRKILTGTSVPLDACLLMGDPGVQATQKAGEHAKEHGIRQVTPELT